ncbi:MAG: hypothetical protein Q8L48_09345 [Archangium sp.]|nr:hypothetical protein [Archangium sp.]
MIRPALLASCLVLFACDEKKAPTPAKAAPAAPAAPKAGLEAPGNDAKVVALARKAMTCTFENSSFDSACADLKAWEAEQDAFRDNKADATLVAFLEDPDEKVRVLGSTRLNGWGAGAFADKALSERILTVAEQPKGKPSLGQIVGHIRVKQTGLFPRIKALLASTEVGNVMRGDVISSLLAANPESDEVFALTRDLLSDPELGRAAFSALDPGGHSKEQETCALYAGLLESADPYLASRSAEKVASFPCPAHFDTLLESLEARLKAKKVTDGYFCDALARVCAESEAPEPQKEKALALTHQIAEDKTIKTPYVRSSAIEAAVACDPEGGKKYIGKFKNDADADVQQKVTRLLEK